MPELRTDDDRPERGVRYPSESLRAAVEVLPRLREAIGFAPAARETIAEALGYSGISGTSSRKIGLLSHFDLITRAGSGAYRISDLGKMILMPTNPGERAKAIAEAAKRPNVYAALWERYKESALPTLLANILTREHGVFAASAEPAARAFRETMEYAGLLRNGVLYAEPRDESPPDLLTPDNSSPDLSGSRDSKTDGSAQAIPRLLSAPVRSGAPSDTTQGYTIPLDANGRVASIHIPLPLTGRDLRKIGAWVSFMSSVVAEEGTPGASEG